MYESKGTRRAKRQLHPSILHIVEANVVKLATICQQLQDHLKGFDKEAMREEASLTMKQLLPLL